MRKFAHHVDSLDVSSGRIVVGLSALEGNVWDGYIKVISLDSLDEVDSYHCPTGVPIVRFLDSSSSIFVAGCDNGYLVMGQVSNLNESCVALQAHDSCISSIDISAHSSTSQSIATAGWEGDIKLWDVSNMTAPTLQLSRAHYGHINAISQHKFESSMPSLLSVGDDGFARLWDPRASKRQSCGIVNLHHRGSACIWDPTEGSVRFLVGTDEGSMLLFDARKLGDELASTGQDALVCSASVHSSRVRQIRATSIPGRSREFVSCSDDCTVATFRVEAGSVFGVDKERLRDVSRFEALHDDYVTDIACAFDGTQTWLLSASTDHTVKKTLLE